MSHHPARRERPAPPASPKVIEYKPPAAAAAEDRGYATIADLASLFWRRKAIVAAAVVLGAIAGLTAAFSQRRTYQARTSFEIRMPNEDYLNRRQLDPNVEPGTVLMEPFLQTQIKLLQSDTLLMQVAGKLGLAQLEEFRGKPAFWRSLLPSTGSATKGPAREMLVAAIRKRLGIRLASQTQVVEVLFESHDPALAAGFANEMAEAYQIQSLQRRIRATTQTGVLLAQQIEGLESSLRSAERELQNFVTTSGLLAGPERDSVEEARLRQLQTMLTAATDGRIAEQSRFEQSAATEAGTPADALESESLRTYRARLTDLRQKLAEALEIYKPAHFRVRQLQAEVLEVERALASEKEGVLIRQRQSFAAAEQRERALRKDYEAQVAIAARQSALSVRYTTLKNKVETQRQLYDSTLRRVQEAQVASTMQSSNVLVIDHAAVPERPFKPNKPFYLVLGSAVGLFAGLVVAFAKERQAGPAGIATQPELAPVIPRPIAAAEPHSAGLPRPKWQNAATGPVETFDAVLRTVLDGMDAAEPMTMVVLTSVCGDEDHAAVASNLAASVARSGKRVLLLDVDRFASSVHSILGVASQFGFSDLLDPTADGALADPLPHIAATGVPGLYALPSGGLLHRLPELMKTPRAAELIDRLRQSFDLVVADAAPVLSATEVHILAGLSDGVVMVTRGAWTAPYLRKAAASQLAARRVRLIGTVDHV